ncbi:MAG: HAD family phosphatase [Actinomycetaceae bacterium]|nr:HAD family phosphatase [Actinomycetaceae bacterium]
MLPEAVLFDLDGTLAQTEQAWFQAELAVLKPFGVTWTAGIAEKYIGASLCQSSQSIVDEYSLPMTAHVFTENLVDNVEKILLRQGVQWMPGAYELLLSLARSSVRVGLVTASWKKIADVIVANAPHNVFSAVVTGDACVQEKPHPYPYLKAADILDVSPEKCCVIEDSSTGLRSAIHAGMHVISVPCVASVPSYEGVHHVRSLSEVSMEFLSQVMECVIPLTFYKKENKNEQ